MFAQLIGVSISSVGLRSASMSRLVLQVTLACAALTLATNAAETADKEALRPRVHTESAKRECIDLVCREGSFSKGIREFPNVVTDTVDRCRTCPNCARVGFSVCAKERTDTSACACAHTVPTDCRVLSPSARRNGTTGTNFRIVNVCYQSALRFPPKPTAINDRREVVVTIEQFWMDPYWKDLRLENLTLFYEFPVTEPDHCDGTLRAVNENNELVHYCTSSLHIDMYAGIEQLEKPLAPGGQAKEYDQDELFPKSYDEYDQDLPPEVQFERDVFAGAKFVRFFYRVQVRRPRQLNVSLGATDKLSGRLTMLTSEVLQFDLQPDVFGVSSAYEDDEDDDTNEIGDDTQGNKGDVGRQPAPSPAPPTGSHVRISKVEIEQRTSPMSAGDDGETTKAPARPPQSLKPIDVPTTTSRPQQRTQKPTDGRPLDTSKPPKVHQRIPTTTAKPTAKTDAAKPVATDGDSASKNTFFETHLNNGGQFELVRNVVLGTLAVCALIIGLTLCYRKKVCFSGGEKKPVSTKTKTVNGYQYNATADEVISSPETERLS
ncbi:hypothetical protein AAVH_18409 [Aphelenchoides avenae]|nr:hypothetical protein AAVH_18409 [Aphelenchus avenae]